MRHLFVGKVLPERATISVVEIKFAVPSNQDIPPGELFVEILLSQIAVRFSCEGEISNLFTLRNLVEDCVRTLLDVAGFYEGHGYDAEISMYINLETSEKYVFGIDIPKVAGIARESGLEILDIFGVLANSKTSRLKNALADLREAIKMPSDTAFFCYRAIESLKNQTADELQIDAKSSEAWDRFRSVYSIDKDAVMSLKSMADPVRHGSGMNAKGVTDDQRAEAFRIAWDTVCKFIEKNKLSDPAQ